MTERRPDEPPPQPGSRFGPANGSAPLSYGLIAKPDFSIYTIRDAVRFIASLTPEKRLQPHWARTIQTLGAASRELRYVAVATMNLETALVLDHLLESEPDRPAK
jgi:hypothetical protein